MSGWLYIALSHNQCLTDCPDGTFLSNGECSSTCPFGQYLFGQNCLTCPSSLTGLTTEAQITSVAACPNINIPIVEFLTPAGIQNGNEDFATQVQTSISTNNVDNIFLSQTLVNSIYVRMLVETGSLTASTTNVQYFKQEVSTLGTNTQSLSSGISRGASVTITLPPSGPAAWQLATAYWQPCSLSICTLPTQNSAPMATMMTLNSCLPP